MDCPTASRAQEYTKAGQQYVLGKNKEKALEVSISVTAPCVWVQSLTSAHASWVYCTGLDPFASITYIRHRSVLYPSFRPSNFRHLSLFFLRQAFKSSGKAYEEWGLSKYNAAKVGVVDPLCPHLRSSFSRGMHHRPLHPVVYPEGFD